MHINKRHWENSRWEQNVLEGGAMLGCASWEKTEFVSGRTQLMKWRQTAQALSGAVPENVPRCAPRQRRPEAPPSQGRDTDGCHGTVGHGPLPTPSPCRALPQQGCLALRLKSDSFLLSRLFSGRPEKQCSCAWAAAGVRQTAPAAHRCPGFAAELHRPWVGAGAGKGCPQPQYLLKNRQRSPAPGKKNVS